MKCSKCGHNGLVHDTRDMPYTYKGETITIHDVVGDYCPECNEAVLSLAESIRTGEQMLQFNRDVNASRVDPSYIVEVRRKLDLTQKQAGEIFGGGVNAFSRYESGKTHPPVSLVHLLSLLDKHPDLLKEIVA